VVAIDTKGIRENFCLWDQKFLRTPDLEASELLLGHQYLSRRDIQLTTNVTKMGR